jgi:hypothetical protein
MIKFFNKTRQKALSDNKATRYLLYAIGEIVLVVIGILIALSINNWNEQKLNEKFEQKMLIELKTSIAKDVSLFESLIQRLDRKDLNLNNLLDFKLNKKQFDEAQIDHNIGGVGIGIQLSYDVGPYETIKALGLDKIKTDTLRSSIIRYFEVGINRTVGFLKSINEKYEPNKTRLSKDIQDRGLTAFTFIKNTDDTYTLRRQSKFREMIDSKTFENLIINEMQRSKELRKRLKPLIRDAKYVENLLHIELQTRFKQ